MLTLYRRLGDRIHIGDLITIRVLAIDHEGVEIGVSAPQSMKVLRGELWDRIRRGLAIFKPVRAAA
jgi:carbon storage regulator